MSQTPEQAQASASDAVADLVAKVDPGGMVLGFVAVVAVMDAEGQNALWTLAPQGQKAWTTLGYLDYCRAVEYGQEARSE